MQGLWTELAFGPVSLVKFLGVGLVMCFGHVALYFTEQ